MNAEFDPRSGVIDRADRDWWRGAVIYQIYPRSFQDSNGDGIGDLPGITRRLPYLASLGVDAVWISPFFPSPMKDFGYDVADYCDVDPMFGTLGDFDTLVATAHRLGLRVMIDLVLSHTSDQHPWFAESRSSREGPKADWYVWADPRPDGTPPNNWLSIFGGSAWQWDSRRRQYYLHNFLASQPDLNLHNPEVQDALLDVARFWLDRGVDGFRLDTINFYFHDKALRDNPPLPDEARNDTIAPAVNPYNFQEHLYDKNQPENIAFLKRLRALMEPYGAAAVGEVGDAQRGLEILGEYTRGTDRIHMCYAFELLSKTRPTAAYIAQVMERVEAVAADGWPCWAFSNHDVERHASRWALPAEALATYATLLMCLRGSACIYQGEELGLPEAELAFEDLRDPYGIEFWPEFKGRDGCRTPMVWEGDAPNAGFSDAAATWLPVADRHRAMAVDRALSDPAALVHHYRRAISLRHAHSALARGDQRGLRAEGDLLRFIRAAGAEEIFCAFNLGPEGVGTTLPDGAWTPIETGPGTVVPAGTAGRVALGPWQCALFRRAGN